MGQSIVGRGMKALVPGSFSVLTNNYSNAISSKRSRELKSITASNLLHKIPVMFHHRRENENATAQSQDGDEKGLL